MPVARTEPRRALLAGLAAVVFAAGLIAVVLVASGTQDGSGGTGDFRGAGAEELVRLQERDGVPALFPDPVGGRQPIFVWHTGGEPDEGWVAYDARLDDCVLELDREDDVLRGCDGEEYPFDGEGLPAYDVTVEGGRVVVDLDGDDEDPSATTTTATTVVESGEVPTTTE